MMLEPRTAAYICECSTPLHTHTRDCIGCGSQSIQHAARTFGKRKFCFRTKKNIIHSRISEISFATRPASASFAVATRSYIAKRKVTMCILFPFRQRTYVLTQLCMTALNKRNGNSSTPHCLCALCVCVRCVLCVCVGVFGRENFMRGISM